MAFDPAEQRRIMGSFATGVTVVTTSGEPPTGLTANAVTSLSLDPPLVLVAIDKKAGSHQAIKDAGCFAMNILTSRQQTVSNKFATPGPKDFSDLDIKTAETGKGVYLAQKRHIKTIYNYAIEVADVTGTIEVIMGAVAIAAQKISCLAKGSCAEAGG